MEVNIYTEFWTLNCRALSMGFVDKTTFANARATHSFELYGGMHCILIKLIDIFIFFPKGLQSQASALTLEVCRGKELNIQPKSITWMVVQYEHVLQ